MMIRTFSRCFGIGMVAGMRSMTAPAATLAAADSPWTGVAQLAAGGELIVDKLPIAPSRLMPGALAVRVVAGAASARAIAKRVDASLVLGTLAGGVGALAGSYGGYYARRYLTSERRVPDFAVALVEDALALGLARATTVAAT